MILGEGKDQSISVQNQRVLEAEQSFSECTKVKRNTRETEGTSGAAGAGQRAQLGGAH